MEDLFEIKLGSMTMDSYENKFLEILKYADFIKDEKLKIQRFLSGIPEYYRDNIQYDRPRNLKDEIWKDKHLYEQNKSKAPYQNNWKDIKKKKKNTSERKVSNLQNSEMVILINKGNQGKSL